MSEAKFLYDRDVRGHLLEELLVNHFDQRGYPVGYNPYSGTEDPRREDYDFYVGAHGQEVLFEAKMDFQSAFTSNVFIEEKTLRNTKAHKMVIGRLILDTFDIPHLIELYNAKNRTRRPDGTFAEQYVHKHLCGGDQANNRGMLLDWKTCKENSRPLWLETRELKQTVQ